MRTPDHGWRRRLLPGPIAIAALILLVAAGCGGEDDEPVRLNGGQGTATVMVDPAPPADRGPVAVTLISTR